MLFDIKLLKRDMLTLQSHNYTLRLSHNNIVITIRRGRIQQRLSVTESKRKGRDFQSGIDSETWSLKYGQNISKPQP